MCARYTQLFCLLALNHLPLALICQVVVGRPWNVECGASSNTLFKKSTAINVRYVSPGFRWSEENLTEEEEKHPEKFNKTRLMLELIYAPPFNVFCTGFNVQYRFLKYKRFSMEIYGGLKFFFVPGEDFVRIRPLKAGKEAWYFNEGILCRLNLGMLAPYADIGYDGILTIGTEINFNAVYRNPKKRYKLHLKET